MPIAHRNARLITTPAGPGAEPALAGEPDGTPRTAAEPGFTARVYALVRQVPNGRVISYGGVAALLGQPRAARGVGQALHALPDDTDVPWWRVLNRNGEISIRGVLHGAARQRQLLRSEGVRFDRTGRVDWRRFAWVPEEP